MTSVPEAWRKIVGILARHYGEDKCKHDARVRGITQQPTCGLLDPAMITTQPAGGMHRYNPDADRQTDRQAGHEPRDIT